MEDLKNILKELIRIRLELDLNELQDNVLFDAGVRIFNSQKINFEKKDNSEELATSKQLFFLKKQGIEIPEGLTKREAITMIKEIKR